MKKQFLAWAMLGVMLFGCSKIKVENPTNDFLKGKRLIKLRNKQLEEVSGMAASIKNHDLFWVHNDSGNPAEIYLIDKTLKIFLTCKLAGIENRDWEDIAVGPGPENGKNYIYVGEIGDNRAKYDFKYIYRFEEPAFNETNESITITEFDTITFQLPDEKKDTETLLLDPGTKDLYVISKREEPVWVYKLKYPYSTKDTLTAEKIVALPFTQVVGGDLTSDGKKLLLKNYEHVYYWNATSGKSIEDLFRQKPFEVPYEIEPQGESITWARDFSGFYTLSEKNAGKDSFLYFYPANKAAKK